MKERLFILSNYNLISLKLILIIGSFTLLYACSSDAKNMEVDEVQGEIVEENNDTITEVDDSFSLPEIDLNHWKVTLPIGENGKPTEVEPPEILSYATNETLLPFMYNDSIDGSLVFYTYPGATTTNSTRSRTELREQMVAGSNNVNWTFSEGGRMKGTIALEEISKDSDDRYHRTIIMQIHGRLTNEQRDLIGQSDNNAPPILKISWDKGKIRLKSKFLKDRNVSDIDLLKTDSWGDDEGYNFNQQVDFDKFTLEIIVTEGKMKVILNDNETVVYEGFDMQRWGVFENYFKAGNYLQTTDAGAVARVKFYDLFVEH